MKVNVDRSVNLNEGATVVYREVGKVAPDRRTCRTQRAGYATPWFDVAGLTEVSD